MSLVSVHNEWDPLEEIIVGTAVGARVPRADRSVFAVEYADEYDSQDQVPAGPYPDRVLKETEEELHVLSEELTKLGVTVRRPGQRDNSALVATPDWQTDGFHDYCPRDGLLAVGQTVIESPMALRARFLESLAYKDILLEYFASGARWLSAPKPRLADEMYEPTAPAGQRLTDLEPVFDAANVLRFGTDLLYLVSDSGNELGAKWLQSALGSTYKVHPCRGLYASTHVDSTIVPLRPGLVLVNPARVNDDNMPDFLRSWQTVVCPELVDIGFTGDKPHCSVWIGMNLLVVRPDLAVVDRRQTGLIKVLEKHGVDVLPLQLTHSRTLGGGFHCATLDVRRTGSLETYRF
ncbi:inosamine-phosphate amidinotransferase [Streptomyces glaucescens]|uniref:Inosamine-phosphate amidinotransferase 1 n=2 Tax=Streptomyces glaucescens TaxID=1907 RepID=STRB1_STRGA|nr:inosamine-phosphate amidinotransferase [Streptomyces glaucescens]Q54258.1 RecName: Full=Inosamine-phosphate amidinotransferase 1; AltName: Full=Aminocyclitol amidinotransferase; Short=ADT; AltName: Full=Inosamine-phosphate amidinotransferase I [Streptomyces glaucescens]AIR96260.1 putative scyllo-inosamine-4-phosphate amidinotransferase [Streptomyces glaucescens]CAA07380.1 StrB1 [Streptomyces glaucescens]CAA55571.1 amidinotransferase [Streptomyces glaucescens]